MDGSPAEKYSGVESGFSARSKRQGFCWKRYLTPAIAPLELGACYCREVECHPEDGDVAQRRARYDSRWYMLAWEEG